MVGTTYAYALLVCSTVAIAAESVSLLFPGLVLNLMHHDPAEVKLTPLHRLLAMMSLVYMVNIGLLIFSGDPFFQMYAAILIGLAVVVWIVKSRLPNLQYVLMVESAVCLTILIGIVRTLLAVLGFTAAPGNG
ncbi:MAG: hypothetical protein GF331_19770 [Chitinivibrionales bacterium]|nr:hypothetical protein [Chitinivibrionales bacterium]